MSLYTNVPCTLDFKCFQPLLSPSPSSPVLTGLPGGQRWSLPSWQPEECGWTKSFVQHSQVPQGLMKYNFISSGQRQTPRFLGLFAKLFPLPFYISTSLSMWHLILSKLPRIYMVSKDFPKSTSTLRWWWKYWSQPIVIWALSSLASRLSLLSWVKWNIQSLTTSRP